MIGLAMLTGWPPDVIRGLTLPEAGAIADVVKARERAAKRRARRPGG